MFCFRRVFIAHLAFDGRSSYTEGVTAFRSQKALYGLFRYMTPTEKGSYALGCPIWGDPYKGPPTENSSPNWAQTG